jgi:hypothetical protein
MSGAAEGSYGIHLNYLPYLLLHAGAGLAEGGILIALICWLFPGKPHPPRELTPLPPMSRDEKRLAWLLAVVLVLWVTRAGTVSGPPGRGWRRRSSRCCRGLALSAARSLPAG